MWPGNLAPDHADLGATDLLLRPVDVGNLLASVEATQMLVTLWHRTRVRERKSNIPSGAGVIDSLNLDQTGAGLGGVTRALVAQVASPITMWSANNPPFILEQ